MSLLSIRDIIKSNEIRQIKNYKEIYKLPNQKKFSDKNLINYTNMVFYMLYISPKDPLLEELKSNFTFLATQFIEEIIKGHSDQWLTQEKFRQKLKKLNKKQLNQLRYYAQRFKKVAPKAKLERLLKN